MAVTVSRQSAEIKVISIFLMPCWLAQVDRLKRAMSQIKRAVSLHQCDAARRGSHFQLLRVMTTARGKKEWTLKVKDSLRALCLAVCTSNSFVVAIKRFQRRNVSFTETDNKIWEFSWKVWVQLLGCHGLMWPSFLSNDVNMAMRVAAGSQRSFLCHAKLPQKSLSVSVYFVCSSTCKQEATVAGCPHEPQQIAKREIISDFKV